MMIFSLNRFCYLNWFFFFYLKILPSNVQIHIKRKRKRCTLTINLPNWSQSSCFSFSLCFFYSIIEFHIQCNAKPNYSKWTKSSRTKTHWLLEIQLHNSVQLIQFVFEAEILTHRYLLWFWFWFWFIYL